MTNKKPTIGIIGAGRLGTTLARQALKAGYHIRIANSRGPETLTLILSVLLPEAQAATVHDTIQQSDIIVLAIPLNQYKTLKPELFRNKTVIDAMNYWPPTEGRIEEFSDKNNTSSEYIQHYLPQATVVKTLNHVAYNELEEHSLPVGSPNRRAIAMASDDKQAKVEVTKFINDVGFDTVDLGDLKEGKKFQPDTNLFNARYTADEIKKLVK
jgi:predicted dinucleotide-binding enzyme